MEPPCSRSLLVKGTSDCEKFSPSNQGISRLCFMIKSTPESNLEQKQTIMLGTLQANTQKHNVENFRWRKSIRVLTPTLPISIFLIDDVTNILKYTCCLKADILICAHPHYSLRHTWGTGTVFKPNFFHLTTIYTNFWQDVILPNQCSVYGLWVCLVAAIIGTYQWSSVSIWFFFRGESLCLCNNSS